MPVDQRGGSIVKTLLIVVIAAIAVALIVTLLQILILGNAIPAVTGAFIGVTIGSIWIFLKRNPSDEKD